jgi:23S rRNA pseudouridine1911/1915/1917 synthase
LSNIHYSLSTRFLPAHINSGFIYRDGIDARFDGMKCIDFYAAHYPHSAREVWLRRIEAGSIFCNGIPAAADRFVKAGDLLEYHRPPWLEPEAPADVSVIFECSGFIVFSKPAGLPVLPGGGFLDNTMLALVRSIYGNELSPVQRLDRGTSGLIVFTRNPDAANTLSELFRTHRAIKTYLAVVNPDSETHWPGEDCGAAGQGITFTQIARMSSPSSCGHPVVCVTTNTGHTHHVRRVLSCAGLPLLGDPLFRTGGMILPEDIAMRKGMTGMTGFLLHAWKLQLPGAPSSVHEFTAPAPPQYGLTI